MAPNEGTLRTSGRWTSYVTRQVGIMRLELVKELGGEPTGRKRFHLQSFLNKFGVYLVLVRELKTRAIVSEAGEMISMLDKNFLAWQHSLSRDLGMLFGDSPAKDEFQEALKNG